MFRKQLGAYEGMLFDFFQEMPVGFWMKNTLIPLDMVFIAADGTMKHVHANAVPMSTDRFPANTRCARCSRSTAAAPRCSASSRATRSSTRSSATPELDRFDAVSDMP